MNPEQFCEVCFALFGVLFETNLSEKNKTILILIRS